MSEHLAASNFDHYIADLHDYLDRLRDLPDIDEQSSAIVADLAQAYSEHPSSMQTGSKFFNVFFFSLNACFLHC